ncbi:MAG: hypothetical protein IT373_16125 [Polyangiaceae bacterium]|nr:hypothetical protein [Polyangiaceae bacterium]
MSALSLADGTVAVDMDPLSLLCRLAASVPPPRYHTVKYGGVLAAASPWRPRVVPRPKPTTPPSPLECPEGLSPAADGEPTEPPPRSPNRGPPYWKSRVLRKKALGYDE